MGVVHAVVNNAALCRGQLVSVYPLLLLQSASEHEMARAAQQGRVDDHLPFFPATAEIRGIGQRAHERRPLAQLPSGGLGVEKGIEIHAYHVGDPLAQDIALEPAQCRKRELARPIQM
jgi:hypothetical protein